MTEPEEKDIRKLLSASMLLAAERAVELDAERARAANLAEALRQIANQDSIEMYEAHVVAAAALAEYERTTGA